jgi:hypothetical protein
MRTTLTLPDDVYHIARSVATSRDISLGDAVALLVRQGLRPPARIDETKPFPCFEVDPDEPPVTLEKTLALEDEI